MGTGTLHKDETAALLDEVRHFHASLFGRPPSASLAEAYLRAHADIEALGALDAAQRRSLQRIVERRLDAVAIEPWLRSKTGRRHPLGAKLLLISYLAETDAAHPEYSRASVLPAGLCPLAVRVLSSAARMLRGLFQKAWHGIL